jgi:mannosyltransferase OCH1-like enzyme
MFIYYRMSSITTLNIIQTWKTLELIPEHYELVMKMRSHNPSAKNLFFSDKTIEQFILLYFPTYHETFRSFKYNIQRIDFFRYLAVYKFGGLYLDLDMDITTSFENLDQSQCIFPVETRDSESGNILLGNYAFYAPANHPFLRHIIDCIVNSIINDDEISAAQQKHTDPAEHVYVYFTTGPELVTWAYHSFPDKSTITLLEPSNGFVKNCFGDYGRHCSFGTWK